MSIVEVRTQHELDMALLDGVAEIHIRSASAVRLSVGSTGSSHVDVRGSSHVDVRGSSHVVAWDSSHVVAWDSSHVVAWGSSHVVAWGSSHVDAWGSSHVDAHKYTAVHKHSTRAEITGTGHVIDMTAVDLSAPADWCEFNGVTIEADNVVLFKAADADFQAGHSYRLTTYVPGSTVVAEDFRADGECGGGLHLGPTPQHATSYRMDAQRWLACRVRLADMSPIVEPGQVAKVKVRACEVLYEVDRYGVAVATAVPA